MTKTKRPEVVVITGASGGLGRAIVHRFARDGAHIGLIARGEDGLAGAQHDVEHLGGQALALPTDVADAKAVEAAAAKTEQTFGPIDIWINDAMVTVFAPFTEITAEEFKRATEVTYLGQVYGVMSALKRMIPRDRGTIVNVGSALAYRGIPLQSAYCGAKHAIQGFTESVRTELLHNKSKVWISMVQMPAMNTPQFGWGMSKMPNKAQPVPPIYQPEVAADAVYYAAHHRRRQIYVGMSTVVVIQLNKLFPWFGDLYLARTGFQSQQTHQPRPADQPANLWHPADGKGGGDWGAHGNFDATAHTRSVETWLAERSPWIMVAGGAAMAGGAALAGLAARRRDG
ncbi:MAG: SDR family oxidoreductase [Ktedonobacterales bacterium]|nr:SDR family oxidoreductase [Ktedonobacterales bacterium]